MTLSGYSNTHTVNGSSFGPAVKQGAGPTDNQFGLNPVSVGASRSTGTTVVVQATLTATVTATWVPDSSLPSDPVPDSTLVSVASTATAYQVVNGATDYNGSADDGYGDAAVSGVSSGTHYFVHAGSGPSGNSFQVPLSLAASDTSTNFASASAGGVTIKTFVPAVSLTGQNSANQALTGQQITATLNGVPSGVKVTKYTWSFSGATAPNPIKNWDGNGTDATGKPQQLFPLTAADLTGTDTSGSGISVNPVSFYDQAKDNVTVKCAVSLKFSDGTTATVNAQSVSVAFLKPTATWGIKSGYVRSLSNRGTGLFGVPYDTVYTDGQSWHDVIITVPSPFSGGTFAFVQVFQPNVIIHRVLPQGSTATHNYQLPNNNVLGLDTIFPYNHHSNADGYSIPQPVSTEIDGDSPSTDIPTFTGVTDTGGTNWDKINTAETFTTYLMYKASSTNSIWVPLKSYTWSWSAALVYQTDQYGGGGWVSQPGNPTAGSTPTANDTNTPPAWSIVHSASDYSHYVPAPDTP